MICRQTCRGGREVQKFKNKFTKYVQKTSCILCGHHDKMFVRKYAEKHEKAENCGQERQNRISRKRQNRVRQKRQNRAGRRGA